MRFSFVFVFAPDAEWRRRPGSHPGRAGGKRRPPRRIPARTFCFNILKSPRDFFIL
jgi:hypothetical protein